MAATAIYLVCQRWFWAMTLGLSALASVFAVLASIIHFQILAAVGFALLAWILSIALAGTLD